MKFDESTINKFIATYKEVHGEQLVPHEATIMLRKLMHLYRVIGRPLPKEDKETK